MVGSTDGLTGFYTALAEVESGQRTRPIVVVHLGDSHIAGDRFSGDLRQKLQKHFGNAGRGLVQPGVPFKYFRARGVTTLQSKGWKVANSLYKAPGPYALTGVRLDVSSAGEFLKLVVKAPRKHQIIEVEFLAGPDAGSVELNANGKLHTLDLRSPQKQIRRFETTTATLTVKTLDDRRVSVLGWSSKLPKPGLQYVSFGVPGATASIMARWDKELVKDQLEHLKPDLIVLGYGTNEGFKDDLNVSAYGQRYFKLAEEMKKMAGNASVLVLGPPDAARLSAYARKTEQTYPCKPLSAGEVAEYSTLLAQKSERLARWHAPPNLGKVRIAQRSAAQRLKAAYWDWSDVMGKECGTYRWANAKTPLAYGDKVHFTDAGARRSATALYRFLLKGYIQFNKARNRS